MKRLLKAAFVVVAIMMAGLVLGGCVHILPTPVVVNPYDPNPTPWEPDNPYLGIGDPVSTPVMASFFYKGPAGAWYTGEGIFIRYPEVGDRIVFDARSSYTKVGTLASCRWTFGDGKVKEGGWDARSRVSYTYTTPGKYIVKLTITDSNGKVGYALAEIMVCEAGMGTH